MDEENSGVIELALEQQEGNAAQDEDGSKSRSPGLIYAVDDDPRQLRELAEQSGYYGYRMENFRRLSDLPEAVRRKKPTAVLVNTNSLAQEPAYTDILHHVQEAAGAPALILFMSEQQDFETRLLAVRMWGKGYFVKPVNVGALIESLDELTYRDAAASEPYRVLIVDDSPMQATFASAHLRKIGAVTHILNDPGDILQSLVDFSPDLIILDMYMPHTNGVEVAGVIRQIKSFVSIPIVFLSSETDRDVQLEAMSLGGDDFLTKPIKPEHLISAVLSRAERYRQLRSLMNRDSLTRLLNNSAMHERLRQEVSRSSERSGRLAYAILDIDSFKKINDTYGHAVGDQVLKNLANLLRQGLSRSDVIGRIGGEEFSVIFPDSTLADAGRAMDELCQRFSAIQHRAGDLTFVSSLSCGVASYPQFSNAAALSSAADQALYKAKNQGRNRVVLAAQ